MHSYDRSELPCVQPKKVESCISKSNLLSKPKPIPAYLLPSNHTLNPLKTLGASYLATSTSDPATNLLNVTLKSLNSNVVWILLMHTILIQLNL